MYVPQKPKQRRYLNLALFYRALISYGISLLVLILLAIAAKAYRELLHYQQTTLWYENLIDDDTSGTPQRKAFATLISEAQRTLDDKFRQEFRAEPNNYSDIASKILIDDFFPSSNSENPVLWAISKTKEEMNVNYGYIDTGDFYDVPLERSIAEEEEDREKRRQGVRNSIREKKTPLNFTYLIVNEFESLGEEPSGSGAENLRRYSEKVFRYLKVNSKIVRQLPSLRINNVYLFDKESGFIITYPAVNRSYSPGLDYRTRPWYKSSENLYGTSFWKEFGENTSGLTEIYIDINDDNKPNAIRTLWYKFKDYQGHTFIWCFDLFIDESSSFLNKTVWRSLLARMRWGDLKLLPILSLPMAGLLFVGFSRIPKRFAGSVESVDSLPKIRMRLHDRKYPSGDKKALRFVVTGSTTDSTYAEQFGEVGWTLTNAIPLQASIGAHSGQRQDNQVGVEYEFTQEYDLSMERGRPSYRCIEVWKVLLEQPLQGYQEIGFFVVKWKTSARANETGGLEIDHLFWENTYKPYLGSFKNQLERRLLTTDDKDFVPVIDTEATVSRRLPQEINDLPSLRTIINSSKYLTQRELVFSSLDTLKELYEKGQVESICSMDLLKYLKRSQQLAEFFKATVTRRYFIEFYPQQFREYYDSLSDTPDLQRVLREEKSLRILVYKGDIQNLWLDNEDVSLISVGGAPRFVVNTFTDEHQESFQGRVSWLEVDLKFYRLLYDRQLMLGHDVSSVEEYLKG